VREGIVRKDMCKMSALFKYMDITCSCGNICIKDSEDVIKSLENQFKPCESCSTDDLKKFSPLNEQLGLKEINGRWKQCKCGRRHLDHVMAHILKIMMEEGVRKGKSTLRDVGTPLITPGYPLKNPPHLKKDSMVLLTDNIDKKCSLRIYGEVPEVKGVLKGDLKDTVGIKDSKSSPHTYQLLAGCDMRCDMVQTPSGPICIYKNQGQIHLEFSKPINPKITALYQILGKHQNPSILDCTCGPGTLGIAALKAGARKVVFNDIWYPAARITALNLEVNGFPVNLNEQKTGLIAEGENYKVYCTDIKDLKLILKEKFDICLVDPFPGVDFRKFSEAAVELSHEVIVLQ
jgi:hypothetical protein